MNQGICECETGFGRTAYGFCANVKAPDYQPFVKRSGADGAKTVPILVTVLTIFNIVFVVDKFYHVVF